MKNKNELKTQAAFDKYRLFIKLKTNTYWLLTSNIPISQKKAIWSKDYENFCRQLARCDRILAKN